MAHYKLAFLGFGNVGRALAELLLRKKTELKEKHDITFSVTGIATGRHGSLVNHNGIDLYGALELVRSSRSLSLLTSELVEDSFDFIQKCKADVLFENTSVNHKTGQPALDLAPSGPILGGVGDILVSGIDHRHAEGGVGGCLGELGQQAGVV